SGTSTTSTDASQHQCRDAVCRPTRACQASDNPVKLTRRTMALGGLASAVLLGSRAGAFGEEGAFHPRILLTGTTEWEGHRKTAPGRWALEVVRRTSAPARLSPGVVRADSPQLLAEPFAVWAGASEPDPLT